MGAYDYTLVEDNNDWYLRSKKSIRRRRLIRTRLQILIPPGSRPNPRPWTYACLPAGVEAKVGGYFNNLRAANQAFVMDDAITLVAMVRR